MIAVIFEVWPTDDHRQHYLDLAAELRPSLEAIDGFVSVERFQSITEPGKMLSLSVFRDEAAVRAWRNTAEHRAAQEKGRGGYFAKYRLRVTHVLRDYGHDQRDEVPLDSKLLHG